MKTFRNALAASLMLFASCATAQDWPARPIRVLVPSAPGGLGDLIMRLIAPAIELKLGQRFLVESKPGADGAIGAAEIGRAAPNGYNLMLAPSGLYAILPHIRKNVPYDPINGYAPVALIVDIPLIVVINANLQLKSLKELAGYIRANPGKLNYGSAQAGSPAHILSDFFSRINGGGMVHVPYKGLPAVALAIQTNEVQVLFTTVAGGRAQLKGGSVRPIAVLARERIPELPEVPTVFESGFPELGAAGNWWGMVAPRGTDGRILERLSSEIRASLADPAVKNRFADVGMLTIGSSPAEFGNFIRSESARWKGIVERTGINPE